jgi:hypothetical protein
LGFPDFLPGGGARSVGVVTSFLVETYAPAAAGIADLGARARSARTTASPAGTPVRYLRSIFVPGDEMCFHLFDARSAEAVREAIERVGLSPDRIVEAHTWYGVQECGQ